MAHVLRKITTRLTTKLALQTPIVSAPMAYAAPGRLAAAVSRAGGLGLIGGGYGDIDVDEAFRQAGNAQVGIGFITWTLAKHPEQLHMALKKSPKAVMLSFGDPAPFAESIKASGAVLICQCQSMSHVKEALAVEADVIVAQGGEAGGHSGSRGTMSFVAETASYLRLHSPDTLLLAAGGIADGRGLAAALMLGADGALMGSRFWATPESGAAPAFVDAAVHANGDATVKTTIPDLARQRYWPSQFQCRVMENKMIREWHARESDARSCPSVHEELIRQYATGNATQDPESGGVVFGEAAGLIDDTPSAEVLVGRITEEAADCLSAGAQYLRPAQR
eukprot:TRINITY_DN19804_c0_g2_i1.p1 TRINITY_DN19804_c0_g2~~TRINITY_DN19804_c0_g2_i1.p1  ORF type:complete len:336 (+),score=60.78 TRINITY_DN19804_c0_g2_i1:45-1052(+)